MYKVITKNLNKIHNTIILRQKQQQQQRYGTYKTIKRPSFISTATEIKKNDNNNNKSKFLENLSEKLSLSKQLRLCIEAGGPITVANYMKQILTNPATGYYMCRDVFGTQGDFITSPEIGQIFGELIAIWLITEWQKIGSPLPLQIIELGPGRGTLSHDIIRIFSHFGITKNISLHLIELSPYLSKLQAQKLCYQHYEEEPTKENNFQYQCGKNISGIPVSWYNKIDDVPEGFSIYLAHEFFDALPIHKFQLIDRNLNKWREILIDINHDNDTEFRFVLSKTETPSLKLFEMNMNNVMNSDGGGIPDQREHIEYSIECDTILELLSQRIETNGGFGLIMDYGHFGDKSDTFRAFKNHKLHNPLIEPGTADVTADVDFKQLKYVCEKDQKLITFGPIEQQQFLQKLGGNVRMDILMKNAKSDDVLENLKSGYDMLTNPNKMGSRFKFFSIFPSVLEEHLKKFPVNGFS